MIQQCEYKYRKESAFERSGIYNDYRTKDEGQSGAAVCVFMD